MAKSFTVGELMKDAMMDPEFEGFSTADDWVLAVDITGGNASAEDYEVLQLGISGVDASLEAQTEDSNYIRGGQSTLKTGTQRTFGVTGDRYIGSAAQDYLFSHKIKYGTGQTVIVPYVYFNMFTGKGEKGTASVIVNNDAAGEAGSKSTIDVQLRTTGTAPTEFTYVSGETLGTLTVQSAAGTATGKTKITVTPAVTSGNSYRYRLGDSVALPRLNEDVSDWEAWDGTTEIPASDSDKIVVAEVTEANKAKKAGKASVTVAA